jgi:GntR family transcriptional repressor for pyruvate dehydrogenase complex
MNNEVFLPVKPKKISEEIVEQLRSLIFEGKLQPGEKLPPERELARSLKVSRPPLREALHTLQEMGLIEIQHGNRTFVRPITTRSIYDPLVSFCKESPQNILHIHEIRKFLDVGAVSLAAERATLKQIESLKRLINQMEEDIKKNRLGAKSDLDFHIAIASATHNQAYNHLVTTVYDLLQEELRIAWGTTFEDIETRKVLFQQHRKIFNAIKNRSPQKGRIAARDHFDYVEQKWKKAFLQQNKPN